METRVLSSVTEISIKHRERSYCCNMTLEAQTVVVPYFKSAFQIIVRSLYNKAIVTQLLEGTQMQSPDSTSIVEGRQINDSRGRYVIFQARMT
ncbi:Hypothetical predicted protein [Podarcis lilfordi]|uniref:Uncharacterized protein n=1 Tax=Podarcis lilfordi TaxID=74358 RepID=A0AA35KN78_9SAUR|nr:Hypothetical predicted protein [Podarcis lilfordi]